VHFDLLDSEKFPEKFPAVSKLLPTTAIYYEDYESQSFSKASQNTAALYDLVLKLRESLIENKDLYFFYDTEAHSLETEGDSQREKNEGPFWVGNRAVDFRRLQIEIDSLLGRLEIEKSQRDPSSRAMFGVSPSYLQVREAKRLLLLFSEKAIENRKAWVKEWKQNWSTKYKKAMEFLTGTDRYGCSISYHFGSKTDFLGDGHVVPMLREYVRELARLHKIAEGWFAEPKYKLGDMVELRSAYSNSFHLKIFSEGISTCNELGWRELEKLKDMQKSRRGFLTIIGINPRIPVGHRRGNKLYKVIVAGDTKPILVEEAIIKKIRGIKKKKKKGDK